LVAVSFGTMPLHRLYPILTVKLNSIKYLIYE
jgi:hypothetical protein